MNQSIENSDQMRSFRFGNEGQNTILAESNSGLKFNITDDNQSPFADNLNLREFRFGKDEIME